MSISFWSFIVLQSFSRACTFFGFSLDRYPTSLLNDLQLPSLLVLSVSFRAHLIVVKFLSKKKKDGSLQPEQASFSSSRWWGDAGRSRRGPEPSCSSALSSSSDSCNSAGRNLHPPATATHGRGHSRDARAAGGARMASYCPSIGGTTSSSSSWNLSASSSKQRTAELCMGRTHALGAKLSTWEGALSSCLQEVEIPRSEVQACKPRQCRSSPRSWSASNWSCNSSSNLWKRSWQS